MPVHCLLKSLRIPLGELDSCNQESSRGDRLRAMTGLTQLQLIGLMDPATDPVDGADVKLGELLDVQLVMSNLVSCMPLLASLEVNRVHVVSAASVAVLLGSSCHSVTTLRLTRMFGGKSGDLWRALAEARLLRHLVITDNPDGYSVRAVGDFSGLGDVTQLHSLRLDLQRPGVISVPVSRLTLLTQVKTQLGTNGFGCEGRCTYFLTLS